MSNTSKNRGQGSSIECLPACRPRDRYIYKYLYDIVYLEFQVAAGFYVYGHYYSPNQYDV